MKQLTREQYNALPDKEKPNWAPYHPVSDPKLEAEIDEATATAKALEYLKPMHDKLAALPIENLPIQKLTEIVDKFNPLLSAFKAIKALLGLPIIGQLVAPLVDFINSLIAILGGIFYIMFVLARGQELFLDGIHQTIQQTDWEGLESAKKEIEKKKKEKEAQKKADKEHNNDIKKKNAEKIKQAIEREKAKEMDELEKRMDEAYNKLQIADSYAQIQKKLDESSYIMYCWIYIKSTFMDIFEAIGIDLSPLDQVTPEQAKAFEKSFPDPSNHIKELNERINKLNKDTIYIPIEELEKIDEESAKEIRKSREDREKELAKSKDEYEKRQADAKKRQAEIEQDALEREQAEEERRQLKAKWFAKSVQSDKDSVKK